MSVFAREIRRGTWEEDIATARAAIMVIREPTEAMASVLDDEEADRALQDPDWRRIVWRAMVDAALKP